MLADDMPFPVHRSLWMARFEASAEPLLAEDRRAGETLAVELRGKGMVAPTDVLLHGRLDRADRRADGRLVLIDYKTGALPSHSQQDKFAKQLLATAVLAERGGFDLPGPVDVAEIRYVGISEKGKVVATELTDEIKARTWAGLVTLLAYYRQLDSGFTARRAMLKREQVGKYDHLARYGEWDLSDPAEPVIVGGRDDG
jgi:RecB family exonuclease